MRLDRHRGWPCVLGRRRPCGGRHRLALDLTTIAAPRRRRLAHAARLRLQEPCVKPSSTARRTDGASTPSQPTGRSGSPTSLPLRSPPGRWWVAHQPIPGLGGDSGRPSAPTWPVIHRRQCAADRRRARPRGVAPRTSAVAWRGYGSLLVDLSGHPTTTVKSITTGDRVSGSAAPYPNDSSLQIKATPCTTATDELFSWNASRTTIHFLHMGPGIRAG